MEGSKWQIGPSMSAGCGLDPMPAASLELMGLYSPRGITRGVQIVAGSSSSLRGCRGGHFLATAIPPPRSWCPALQTHLTRLIQTLWLEPQPGLEDQVGTQKRTQVNCGVSLEKASLTINLERRG